MRERWKGKMAVCVVVSEVCTCVAKSVWKVGESAGSGEKGRKVQGSVWRVWECSGSVEERSFGKEGLRMWESCNLSISSLVDFLVKVWGKVQGRVWKA